MAGHRVTPRETASRELIRLRSEGAVRGMLMALEHAGAEETVEVLGTPGAAEAIHEGLADAVAGRFADNDALKSRYEIV